MPRPTAFSRGNSTIFVCWPSDITNASLAVMYHNVSVDANLAQRLTIDVSKPFIVIEGLDRNTSYSVQLEMSGGCGGNQTSEAVYVVTGKRSKS